MTSFDSISENCSRPELKIGSENSLFDIVLFRIDHDIDSFHLLEFVAFQYLSIDLIPQFCTSHKIIPINWFVIMCTACE
jgi:hypothetical protein